MKNKLLIATFALLTSSYASAQGFTGPAQSISTVKEVLNSSIFSDDMPVTLIGHIKSSQGGELYLFTDTTGEITVEIDHDKWLGQSVTPTTNLQIMGEVDSSLSGVKVDVDTIKLL